VAANVALEVSIDGAAGNDRLSAGGGAALLRGGPGNDILQGGAQGDTLVGGDGDDVLNGGSGGPRNGATFLNALTVHDDAAVDQLTGGGGSDWFLYNFSGDGIEDIARDIGGSETGIQLDL